VIQKTSRSVASTLPPKDRTSSLDVDKQVSFQDVFTLFVLLRRIVRSVIFPPEGHSAFYAIDIAHRVVPSRHLAITWFAFDDVHHSLKQIRPPVLSIECP